MKTFICTECLSVGKKVMLVQGSWVVEAFLFLFGVLPGIAYSAWRESSKKYVCPGCKKESMIPVSTPRGRQLVIDSGQIIDEGAEIEEEQSSVPEISMFVFVYAFFGALFLAFVWSWILKS